MRARALTLGLIGVLTVTCCGNSSEHGPATAHDSRAATAVPAREHEPEPGEEAMPHVLEPVADASEIIPRPGPLGHEAAAMTDVEVVYVADVCPAAPRMRLA